MSIRIYFYCCLIFLFGCASNGPKVIPNGDLIKIEANPEKGFNFAYYLYLPPEIEKENHPILLVEPNNTGSPTDDMVVHDRAAKK